MNEDRSLLAKASIESIIESGKTYPLEVAVVDNGDNGEDSKYFLSLAQGKRIAVYVRNATNLSFGYGRDQAFAMTHGEFVLISDNDIIVPLQSGWIDALLKPFWEYPDEKIITSPFRYTDGRAAYRMEPLGPYERNQRAGSNFFLIRRTTFMEVGLFPWHRIAGSLFTDALVRAGYGTVIVPDTGIRDGALRSGYNHKQELEIRIPLTNGQAWKIT